MGSRFGKSISYLFAVTIFIESEGVNTRIYFCIGTCEETRRFFKSFTLKYSQLKKLFTFVSLRKNGQF